MVEGSPSARYILGQVQDYVLANEANAEIDDHRGQSISCMVLGTPHIVDVCPRICYAV
jgi:hypothetical protein